MRIAYLDCFSGISGDMAVGAFLDAGLGMAALRKELARLPVHGYTLKRSRVRRGAIAGTKFDCVVRGGHGHAHRSLGSILSMIRKSRLGSGVKRTAACIFETIGTAEAAVHGLKPGAGVTLHELGSVDSIVDIVGTAVALETLGIDAVHASPVTMGRTVVVTAHGALPIPGPASLELLKGAPVAMADVDAELVTPTGAGIVRALAAGFGPMPAMRIRSVGYGAGSRDLPGVPNMLRAVIGDTTEEFTGDTVTVLDTNIDDMPPQYAAYLCERLLKAGALDVYITPVQMKKGRPGILLTALAAPSDARRLASLIFAETTTIGIRFREERRAVLDRKSVAVKTRFGAVAVKVSSGPDRIRTVMPEFEDCARLARSRNVPLKDVAGAARRAYDAGQGGLCDR